VTALLVFAALCILLAFSTALIRSLGYVQPPKPQYKRTSQ
jgi:hypothetical protein